MNNKDEMSLGGLLGELARETSALFRKEIQLARTEVGQKLSQAGSGIAEIAVGGAVAFIGLQCLIAAAVIGLAYVVELWLSAVVVGIAVLLIGFAVLKMGTGNLRARKLLPERTIESIKQDRDWAKEQIR